MSALEKAFGVIRNAMLIDERLDHLEEDLKGLGGDLAALSRSHAGLAERVARIEGIIEGAAMASGRNQPRISE